jgi:general secretion pathway protein K
MKSKEQGYALVAVLWAVTLLMIMAASFSLTLRRSSGLLEATVARAQGIALASAALNYAMLQLSVSDQKLRWRGGGVYTLNLPGGKVRVRLFDEAGKIDINSAQYETLSHILGPLLVNSERGSALAAAIVDWRDADDVKLSNGAEATEYSFEKKGYVPANRPFQSIEELQMLMGMTPELYKKLEPMLTIYSGQDGINPRHASRKVLSMMPGLDSATIASFMQSVQAASSKPSDPFSPITLPIDGVPVTTAGEVAYTSIVEAVTEGAPQPVYVKVVIKRERVESGLPFVIASWKQQYSAELLDD